MNDTPKQSFLTDLDAIEKLAVAPRVSIAQIETVLEGRGFASFAMIFSLPFVQPVPLPGVSIVIGFMMLALGLRLCFGHHGGLPHWLRRREIDAVTLLKITHGARRIFASIDRLFRRRLTFLVDPPCEALIGVGIMLSGLALVLPLPPVVLFSNSLPAWAIIFLSIGYLERDGLFVILGHVVAIGTWVYFFLLWEAVSLAWGAIIAKWHIPIF